jgi:hypothetical protein
LVFHQTQNMSAHRISPSDAGHTHNYYNLMARKRD